MQALETMPPSVFSVVSMPSPKDPRDLESPPVVKFEEQLVPLDLIKVPTHGKENQAQDLSWKKNRQPLTHVNDKWRPW